MILSGRQRCRQHAWPKPERAEVVLRQGILLDGDSCLSLLQVIAGERQLGASQFEQWCGFVIICRGDASGTVVDSLCGVSDTPLP